MEWVLLAPGRLAGCYNMGGGRFVLEWDSKKRNFFDKQGKTVWKWQCETRKKETSCPGIVFWEGKQPPFERASRRAVSLENKILTWERRWKEYS